MIKVRVLGATQSAANIRRMSKGVRKEFYKAMLDLSRQILTRSKEIVPYDTGALQRSGKVKGYPGQYPVVYTSYGSSSVPYALIQHENMNYFHPGGKKAKYLEIAVKEFEPKVEKTMATAVRNETRKYSMAGGVPMRI